MGRIRSIKSAARKEMDLECGKCGSKMVVTDSQWGDSERHRVRSLRCLVCGNRQMEGMPCRWPFLDRAADRAARRGKKAARPACAPSPAPAVGHRR